MVGRKKGKQAKGSALTSSIEALRNVPFRLGRFLPLPPREKQNNEMTSVGLLTEEEKPLKGRRKREGEGRRRRLEGKRGGEGGTSGQLSWGEERENLRWSP